MFFCNIMPFEYYLLNGNKVIVWNEKINNSSGFLLLFLQLRFYKLDLCFYWENGIIKVMFKYKRARQLSLPVINKEGNILYIYIYLYRPMHINIKHQKTVYMYCPDKYREYIIYIPNKQISSSSWWVTLNG